MSQNAPSFAVLGPLMGGFGSQAFLGYVREPHRERSCVLVFLPDEVVDKPDVLARVVAETEAASQIDHQNVLAVLGAVRLDEGCARVVELAEAESLRAVYSATKQLGLRLPPPVTVAVVAGACMGVQYAHELGRSVTGAPYVHGGLRPETLLVGMAGVPKVTGFGAQTLAEVLSAEKPHGGRDAYTSIEQHYGGRAAATVHSDVYALGGILYEALTGKTPIAADVSDAQDQMQAELLARPAVSVTEKLAAIVVKATRKHARDRFSTVLEMREALLESGACANDDEVAHFMEGLFPPSHPPRAARAQLLARATETPPSDVQILTWYSALAPVEPAPVEAPQPVVVAPPPVVTAPPPAQPAPQPARRVVQRQEPDELEEPEEPAPRPRARRTVRHDDDLAVRRPAERPAWVWAVYAGLGVTVGGIGTAYLARPSPVQTAVHAPAPQTPPAPVAAPAAPAEPPPAPDPEPVRPREPATPAPARLSISTSPPMAIFLDGKPVGQGSASVATTGGNHTVRARDKKLGIDLRRSVSVKAGGSREVSLEAGQGTLVIDAPGGCDVVLDGRKVGRTPMGPLKMYEGAHRMSVFKGKTEFKQNFQMKPNYEATLHVEFHAK